MTFDSLERSNYDAIKTVLYEFALGATARWRFASGTQNVTLLGNSYRALPISDSGIVQSGDTQNDDFTVTMPADTNFAQLFTGTPPSEPILLTVREINRGDDEAPVVWAGIVKNGKRTSLTTFDVICKTLTASLNRMGVRLAWGRGCPHALYDRACRVNKDDFATAAQIVTLGGAGFTAAIGALGDGYLSGGFVTFNRMAGVLDTRAIESHIGTRVNLLGASDGLAVGMWVTLYPGCDRVTSTCEAKFNNLSNYGGFPHLPTKNPFDNDPVF